MRKAVLFLIFIFFPVCVLFAAPCYGTKMPQKNKFFSGVQAHSIFKRYLEDEHGKVRSSQQFLLLSYGVLDWLSIDLKGGAGYIKQHPVGNDEVDYPASFAGGYGFRMRFFDKRDVKIVFGFQHISVHPYSSRLGNTKNRAILDDWQVSLLASRDFLKLTPYLGVRWSRVDYIHLVGEDRKRWMSDATKSIGLIFGLDIPVTQRLWVNLEAQLFDSEAAAFSVNYKF